MTLVAISSILGLFAAVLFVLKWQLSRPIKKAFGISQRSALKPFDCLPCMSFWLSAIIATALTICYSDSTVDVKILLTLTAAALAFVVALIFDK